VRTLLYLSLLIVSRFLTSVARGVSDVSQRSRLILER